MLGMLGPVAGILQTFSQVRTGIAPDEVIRLYSPAITATGSGLFMALVNILPTWVVLIGRDLIRGLGGAPADTVPADEEPRYAGAAHADRS